MQVPPAPSHIQGLETLFHLRPVFLAWVRRRVRCPADAEDIVQTAFLRCFEHRRSLHGDDRALPWFRGILANATTDHFRRRAAQARALQALEVEPREPADAQEWRQPLASNAAIALLDRLRPEHRQALHTVYLEARRLPEFAERAGITVSNAAVRVFRARQAARKLVGDRDELLSPAAAA